jgi:virginiamycin B lyase
MGGFGMDAQRSSGERRQRFRMLGAFRRASRRAAQVRVEPLESRQLLTGAIGDALTLPAGVTIGPMVTSELGPLYYAEVGGSGSSKIGVLSSAGNQSEISLPSTDAAGKITGLAADAAGNVWIAYSPPNTKTEATGMIGEISSTGNVTEFFLPRMDMPGSATLGPDGNIWVSIVNRATGASLAKVTPQGKITEYPVKGATELDWLTAGRDGNLWFTDGTKIGKMTTSGAVTEYGLTDSSGAKVDLRNAQLTSGADGNIWFLGLGGLSNITPQGKVMTSLTPGTALTALSSAGDGNLWFSFLPASNNSLAQTPGAVIVRMTPTGSTTQLSDRVDTSETSVQAMTPGPDATLWVNDGGSKIKQISLASVPSFSPPIVYPTTTTGLTSNGSGLVSGTIVTFNAYSAGAQATDFTASINWGDGHISTGTVTANQNGGFNVTGSNTYSAPAGSQFKVTVTVQQEGLTAQVFNAVTVAAAGSTPTSSTPMVLLGQAHTPAQRRAALKAIQEAKLAARHAAQHHPKGPAIHAKATRHTKSPTATA